MHKLPLGPAQVSHLSTALRKLSFFSGMSLGDLERFIAITNLYEYDGGRTVFKKGDVGDALYVVHTGMVRVISKPIFFWPAKTIATLGPDDIFGEMALLDQPYRTATVVTEGPTQLFVLLSSNFNGILNENPAFARDIRQIAQTRAFETKNL